MNFYLHRGHHLEKILSFIMADQLTTNYNAVEGRKKMVNKYFLNKKKKIIYNIFDLLIYLLKLSHLNKKNFFYVLNVTE